ncbi:MAG: SCP2 sterol-binding domain-containing protein [Solirubrobacteraceae bacterium]|nr:SCP2 sterol-binding domain-containing protein [Solirubrobacteraceae bacterium]
MAAEFSGPKEFRVVMDRIFTLMSEDPDMGPKLRDADVPQRFEFEDVDLVVNIRAARPGEEGCLFWQWDDEIDWKPKVQMKMSSQVANKYFQGKENVALAAARGRIKTRGDFKAALALIPITKPVYAQYRAVVEAEYPHLEV